MGALHKPSHESLTQVAHRPWPLPTSPWVMAQTWSKLLFAHWPVAPEALRPLVPRALALDTYDGQAWVGVVPFMMSGVRFRGLPAIPTTETFPELNVRTYVTAAGKTGVYFFSLDAGSILAVAGARALFSLPYYPARFTVSQQGDTISYSSQRTMPRRPPAEFAARYRPSAPPIEVRPGTLEDFLTARYCLYTTTPRGTLLRADIHHAPWPLQPAEGEITRNTMAAAAGITLPSTAPLLYYAERLPVVAWRVRALSPRPPSPRRERE